MAEPSKRKSSVRRQISLVGCGDSFPQRITLNERICEYIPLDTDHTAILHECIRLAWSMVFSTTGARMTAQSLVESWLPPSLDPALSPTEKDQVFAKAVLEAENFKNSYPVTVFMDSNMRKCSEVDCDEVVKIRLNFYLQQHAAEAQSRSLAADGSPNAQFRRHQHVFFIALLIANCLQHTIHKVAVRTFIAPGWRFEEMIFGGHLIRLVERVRPSYPDRMSNGISGLAVMMPSECVPGYRIISDEVIKAVVEGAECDQYFPLGDQHNTDFVAGIHPDAAYRSGDGSDELYRARSTAS